MTSNLRLSFAIPICEICVICGLFSLNQLLLSFQPPTVSAQTLIFPNDAVTWNHEGDVIARACAGDARALVAAFDSAGLVKGKDYTYEEVQGGEFNELAWQARVEPMLKSLYPPSAATQPAASSN